MVSQNTYAMYCYTISNSCSYKYFIVGIPPRLHTRLKVIYVTVLKCHDSNILLGSTASVKYYFPTTLFARDTFKYMRITKSYSLIDRVTFKAALIS
jgi:hypothetical protein